MTKVKKLKAFWEEFEYMPLFIVIFTKASSVFLREKKNEKNNWVEEEIDWRTEPKFGAKKKSGEQKMEE